MRALITGVGGFAGTHLARYLLSRGLELAGLTRPGAGGIAPDLGASVQVIEADLGDAGAVAAAVRAAAPALVFHLAAQASVPEAWRDPEETYRSNVLGQLHLLEAASRLDPPPRVLIVSSNEVYGNPGLPERALDENQPLAPLNPYAVTKAAQDLMGLQYALSGRLPVVRVRPFNHIGPGQSDAYVASAFARQVAEAEARLREPIIRVGNLSARRDFSDVRDIVAAYHLLAQDGVSGEAYNLGSGRPIAIQSLLDFFVSQSRVPLQIERDPARYRPVDNPGSWADITKVRNAVKWAPSTSLEKTLLDVLHYWRVRVRDQASG